MITIDFNEPAWDHYVDRGCINGSQPPNYTVGSNYIRDADSGLRVKMIGGSMTVPARQGSFRRKLFFTYQDCDGQNAKGKYKAVGLIAWFPPPKGGQFAVPRKYSLVKLVLGTAPDPVSTRPLVVNIYGTPSALQPLHVVASRSVPANGNITFNFSPKVVISAVEVLTDHIENELLAISFNT